MMLQFQFNDRVALSSCNRPASFKGREYSYGDELIADRANPAIKKKNAGLFHFTEGWCHHLATVIKEQY